MCRRNRNLSRNHRKALTSFIIFINSAAVDKAIYMKQRPITNSTAHKILRQWRSKILQNIRVTQNITLRRKYLFCILIERGKANIRHATVPRVSLSTKTDILNQREPESAMNASRKHYPSASKRV